MNIIISGASQGIGYETALYFANEGHQVLAISRNNEKLQELGQHNNKITALAIDLLDENLDKLVEEKILQWDKVDVLINNAGQLINKPFIECSQKDFIEQFESNLISAISLIKAVYKRMMNHGHIVNITSMGGYQGSIKFPGLSAYSASKGALNVLTECLAEEFGEYGISVNALALGAVQTAMLEKAFPDYKAPLKANEIAKYIFDFALHGNSFYNGQILPVTLGNP